MICDTCLGLLSAATNLTHPTVVSWVVSSLAVVGEGVDGLVGGLRPDERLRIRVSAR